jgi:hypothetical protein
MSLLAGPRQHGPSRLTFLERENERLRAENEALRHDLERALSNHAADLTNQQLPGLMVRAAVLTEGMDIDPDDPIEGPVDLAHQQKAPDDV